MDKYEAIDAAILRKLPTLASGQSGAMRFVTIYGHDIRSECERITADENKGAEAFRILDRRLQALRKARKIFSSSRGWYIQADQVTA